MDSRWPPDNWTYWNPSPGHWYLAADDDRTVMMIVPTGGIFLRYDNGPMTWQDMPHEKAIEIMRGAERTRQERWEMRRKAEIEFWERRKSENERRHNNFILRRIWRALLRKKTHPPLGHA